MSTEERLDSLEYALKELAYAGRRTEMSLDLLSSEMREFKAEMRIFQNEMLAFKDEMLAFKDDMRTFKREMLAFKDEMSSFKDTVLRDHKQMNRKWGELANKWGTFTEDVVLPNFPRVLERYFGANELEAVLPRPRVKLPGEKRGEIKEFDLVAWTAEAVFWNETKSHGTVSEFRAFITDDSIFRYFPALEGRTLIRIASALYFSPESVAELTRKRVYAMMLGDETMEIVNFDDIAGREVTAG